MKPKRYWALKYKAHICEQRIYASKPELLHKVGLAFVGKSDYRTIRDLLNRLGSHYSVVRVTIEEC